MHLPRNWNHVGVKLRAIDNDPTHYDPVFKVPLGRKVRATEYIYRAQINLGSKAQERKSREDTGDRPDTRGHILLRTCDLEPNSLLPKPKKGWMVVTLYVGTDQEQAVEYLIEEVRHESPKGGRPLLIYCPFMDNIEKGRTP